MLLRLRLTIIATAVAGLMLVPVPRTSAEERTIAPGSKVFLAPSGGFETHLKAALEAKKVPLTVVESRDAADFEITSHAETQKASTAKKIFMGSFHSKEEASIQVSDVKSGDVVFAYSYHTDNSAHGQKSSAESCAKHLKEKMEGKKK
jgi:hypothetical protein